MEDIYKLKEKFSQQLDEFVIDSSSLIYIYRINELDHMVHYFNLVILSEVYDEIARKNDGLQLILDELLKTENYNTYKRPLFPENREKEQFFLSKRDLPGFTDKVKNDLFDNQFYCVHKNKKLNKLSVTDYQLVKAGLITKIPIITEDKLIMGVLKESDLFFINSLLVLYLLSEKKIISKEKALKKLFKLSSLGHYSNEIFKYVFDLFCL